jgi:peptidoglycan/xylan/chitin deacetylase (PgdA/CDA1 family)
MKKSKTLRMTIFVITILLCIMVITPVSAIANTDARQRLPVLMYHSVLGTPYYAPSANNPYVVSEENFAAQMKYLYDNGYTTITTEQLTDFLFGGKALPDRAVLLTFDDGYLDNAVFAYPIMKQYGFTGAVFVITSLITETPGTIRAYPHQYMSLEDMQNTTDVFEFGSHTDDMHSLVGNVPRTMSASTDEIRADLRKSFEYPMTFRNGFAYPRGMHNNHTLSALRAEGVQFAFTTRQGYVTADSPPMTLNRYFISGDMTLAQFSRIVSVAARDTHSNVADGSARTVTASALNVRSGAGTNHRVVGVVRNGDMVFVLDTVGNWSRISWQGSTAYVHSSYLR